MNDIPNFSEHSLDTLEDILEHIDKEKYPERVKIINDEIDKKKAEYELQQKPENKEPETLTDEDKKAELVKLVSIASVVFLFSSYAVYIFRSIIVNQFMLAYLPLFLILLLSFLSIIFLSKRNYVGVELLMYSQVPLSISFLLGNFYYFSNIGYLIFVGVTLGSGLDFTFDIEFGKYQFTLGNIDSEYSFLFGINVIPLILYYRLKLRKDYYKKVFE